MRFALIRRSKGRRIRFTPEKEGRIWLKRG